MTQYSALQMLSEMRNDLLIFGDRLKATKPKYTKMPGHKPFAMMEVKWDSGDCFLIAIKKLGPINTQLKRKSNAQRT